MPAPTPGTIEDGHQYIGGNPADPNSWRPVQQQKATAGILSPPDQSKAGMIDALPMIHAIMPDLAKGLVETPAYKQAQKAAEIQQRVQMAKQFNLDVNTPTGQHYALTGQLPKLEPDMKAVREADQKVRTQKHLLDDLARAQQLSATAYAGPLASTRAIIPSLWGSTDAVDTGELDNVITNSILPTLKGSFGGRVTNADLDLVKKLQAGSSMPADTRKRVLQNAIRRANDILQEAQDDAHNLRTGQYYDPRNAPTQQRQAPDLSKLSTEDLLKALNGR